MANCRRPLEWVACKDRLPDIGDLVIVYTPKLDRKVKALMRLIPYEGATEFFWDDYRGGATHVQEAVTHWMPLPKPPL